MAVANSDDKSLERSGVGVGPRPQCSSAFGLMVWSMRRRDIAPIRIRKTARQLKACRHCGSCDWALTMSR